MEENKQPEQPTKSPEFQGAPQIYEPKLSARQEMLVFIWETVKIAILALAIIIPIRYFLVQPFFVSGASMETTFEDNDYILIDEITYRFRLPERGEIIVFRSPQNTSEFFIKRIVGLPEETIEIKDNKVTVYNKKDPQGKPLDENSYLDKEQYTTGNMRIKLDPNEYFVMGDNRIHSSDSRRWGPVNKSLITGKVFFRAWPINKAEKFPEVNYGL
jgi:signal peptidase I